MHRMVPGAALLAAGLAAATAWERRADLAYLAIALPLFALAVSRLLAQSYSPFLYFAF